MSKPVQLNVLFQFLKAAKPGDYVTKADVATALDVAESSLPVYFFWIKKYFNVEVETQKNGRTIVGYRLSAASRDIVIPENGRRSERAKTAKAKKVGVEKKTAPKPPRAVVEGKKGQGKTSKWDLDIGSPDADDYDDGDLADIRAQLGL